MKKKILSILLVLVTVITVLPMTVGAASPVTKTVDLTGLNNDTFGQGYTWDNLDCILTLDSINLSTTDTIGIKLPAGSTVILNGDNKISASSYGIHCLGALTVKGDGTLTVSASVYGIAGMSTKDTDTVVFRSGTVNVNGAQNGIYTENSELVFSGATVNVTASECSVFGKNIKMVSGNLTLEGKIKAKGTLSVSNTNLTAVANDRAIEVGRGISFSDVEVKVGDSLSSLSKVTEYTDNRKAVQTVAAKKDLKRGFLFGGKLPAFVDYIVLTLIVLGAAAVIIVPIIIRRKKTAALIAKSEAAKNKKSSKK